ncbi:MAG TPA: HAD-IC family P-type ATPase [Candidatus Saccharimonadales bacterium]|nr:HAD-IC family P-type ATPase [Candidatus Saccharimonadales bacterium]
MVKTVPAEGQTLTELLSCAGVAELNSEHPLGRAILEYVRSTISVLPAPDEFRYEAGRGITAMAWGSVIRVGSSDYLAASGIAVPRNSFMPGITQVLVARDRQYLGAILLDDQLRGEAAQAIQELKSMSVQTVMLTGDSSATAARIGRELHLGDSIGQLLPEQKLQHIMALQNGSRKVAMVGDGINDAPALAQADVGMAMGSGTDIAQESAGVILIGNNLLKVVDTLRIARRCHQIILQNFYGTLAVDSAGIVLSAFGFLTPLLAAFIHVSSELVFILNAARMLPARRPRITE